MGERNNVDKDSFDGLQINQNSIWKKIEENNNETIDTLNQHEGPKTRLKDNKSY